MCKCQYGPAQNIDMWYDQSFIMGAGCFEGKINDFFVNFLCKNDYSYQF